MLDNSDGQFDPRNNSSPLYPHLLNKEERDAWVYVKDGDSGVLYDLIKGRLVDFKPINDRRGRKSFTLHIEDGIRHLHKNKVNVDIMTSVDTVDALGACLDDVQWPWGRNFGSSVDTIPWWWVYNRYAYPEIMDIVESELGNFFVAANGDATFLNRFYSDADPLTLNGYDISPEVSESQPSDTVKDRVILRIHPRILRATATVWTMLDVPIFIADGASKTFWPEFTYDNRPVPVQNPLIAATTDYTFYENSNGTGTDLTAGLDVSFTPFGQGGKIVAENNSGTDGWIIGMKMRGDALDSPDAVRAQAGDGQNVLEMDLTWQQKFGSGQDNADYIHTFLSNPDKYYLTVSIQGNPEKQFSRDLYRWVDLALPSKSISDMFRISKIKHKLLKRRVVDTTFWLEPTLAFSSSNETQLPFQLPARFGEP
jgi:hypothetical protein